MKNTPRKTHARKPSSDTQELECHPISANLYPTNDLNFTAFLKSKYHLKVIETSRDRQGRYEWVLSLGELNPHELFNDFISSPISLFVAEQRNLKTQIRNM